MNKKTKPPKNIDFRQLAKSIVDPVTNEIVEPTESRAVNRGASATPNAEPLGNRSSRRSSDLKSREKQVKHAGSNRHKMTRASLCRLAHSNVEKLVIAYFQCLLGGSSPPESHKPLPGNKSVIGHEADGIKSESPKCATIANFTGVKSDVHT